MVQYCLPQNRLNRLIDLWKLLVVHLFAWRLLLISSSVRNAWLRGLQISIVLNYHSIVGVVWFCFAQSWIGGWLVWVKSSNFQRIVPLYWRKAQAVLLNHLLGFRILYCDCSGNQVVFIWLPYHFLGCFPSQQRTLVELSTRGNSLLLLDLDGRVFLSFAFVRLGCVSSFRAIFKLVIVGLLFLRVLLKTFLTFLSLKIILLLLSLVRQARQLSLVLSKAWRLI